MTTRFFNSRLLRAAVFGMSLLPLIKMNKRGLKMNKSYT